MVAQEQAEEQAEEPPGSRGCTGQYLLSYLLTYLLTYTGQARRDTPAPRSPCVTPGQSSTCLSCLSVCLRSATALASTPSPVVGL